MTKYKGQRCPGLQDTSTSAIPDTHKKHLQSIVVTLRSQEGRRYSGRFERGDTGKSRTKDEEIENE